MYNFLKKSNILILLFLIIISFSVYYFYINKSNNPESKINKDKIISLESDSKPLNQSNSTSSSLILEEKVVPATSKNILPATTTTKLATKKVVTTTTPVAPKNNTSSTKNSTTMIPVVPITKPMVEIIKPTITSCTEASGGFGGQIENEINSVRASYGLSRLSVCKELRNSSYKKYLDIIAQNNFTHDWAGGKSLYDVIVGSGYIPKSWGEILEYGSDFTTAKDHVDNWMSSPTHKAIILGKDYTHFGVYVGGWTVEDIGVDMGIAHFGKK